jgi:hypothetical protein
LPLGGQQADDLAGKGLDAQAVPDRVAAAVQLAPDGIADHADGFAGGHFLIAEAAAVGQCPVSYDEIVIRAAADGGRPVVVAGNQGDCLAHCRRHGPDAGHLAAQRLDIGQLEGRGAGAVASRAKALAGPHDHQVAAETGNLVGHGPGRAIPQRHHRDHRRHADHDAEHGEAGTQQVAANLAQRQQQGIAQHAATGARLSLSIMPSTKCTIRCA